jgi:8-amino-7-oxononanoate synthase
MRLLVHELAEQLDQLRDQNLYRELHCVDSPQSSRIQLAGQTLLNFSSNDYLGLANHPALKEAAIAAVQQFGCGSGASRLICGSLTPHHELEEVLAAFKNTDAALTFSSGYAAVLGTICALLGKNDVVIIDKLVHACIVDAAKLCGAKLRVFRHNDLNDLERMLRWAAARSRNTDHRSRTFIVTESVFSMDGDLAPLRNIVELKEKYGAWLMVDEAHATGLFGERRRGLAEEFGVADRIEVQMGTLGKALGAAGGYICGSRALIDLLINRARSLIFSTAPAKAAIDVVQSEEGAARRVRLWARVDEIKNGLVKLGWPLPPVRSAIIPLLIGDEARAIETATELRQQGVFIPAIRYPSVARGQARLRLTANADHTAGDVDDLLRVLNRIKRIVCNS